jgi:hypothetical protein
MKAPRNFSSIIIALATGIIIGSGWCLMGGNDKIKTKIAEKVVEKTIETAKDKAEEKIKDELLNNFIK